MTMQELLQFIRADNIEGVREICYQNKNEMSPNYLQNKRTSVINFAIKSKCSLDLITVLLESGFNPSIPKLFSPLKYAIWKKDIELASLLIKYGATINANILVMIIKRGMSTLINLVMEANAKIEVKKGSKITALFASINSGRVDLIQKILSTTGHHISIKKYKCCSRNRTTPLIDFISKYFGKCIACEYEAYYPIHYHCDEMTGFNILTKLHQKCKTNGSDSLHDIIHYGESNTSKAAKVFKMYLNYLEENDPHFDMNYIGKCSNPHLWNIQTRRNGLLTCAMFQRQEEIVKFLCLRGANVGLLCDRSIIRLDHFNEREKFMEMLVSCGFKIRTNDCGSTLLDSDYHNLPGNYDTTGINYSEYLTHTMEDCCELERIERVMELYEKSTSIVLSLKCLARNAVTQNINLRTLSCDESIPKNIMSIIRMNEI